MEAIDKAQYLIRHFDNKANKVVKEIQKAKGFNYYWSQVSKHIKDIQSKQINELNK